MRNANALMQKWVLVILIGCFLEGALWAVGGCSEEKPGDAWGVDDPAAQALDVAASHDALGSPPVVDRRFRRLVMEGRFTGVDGNSLRYKRYEYVGRDVANVIFLGGFADFIEKYEFLFTSRNEYPGRSVPGTETLADLPVSFYAFDQVGHGESEGLPSHIDDFDTYVENVKAFVDHVKKLKGHRKPIILMSHSMGGLVAARFAETYPEYVDALIFSSPMWGIQDPPGVPAGILRQLADFYVAVGLDQLCSSPPNIDALTLAAIAVCHADPTLNACFNDPSIPGCDTLTMCLLQGQPNNCGLLPIDFAGLNALFQSLYLMPPGCDTMSDPEAICTFGGPEFEGGTTDFNFCVWAESHPLAGPKPTFGWLAAGYDGIDDLQLNLSAIDMPTLVLTSPIDPIVIPASHVAVCQALPSCTLVPFPPIPEEGIYYFHQLIGETERANVIAVISQFLSALNENHTAKGH